MKKLILLAVAFTFVLTLVAAGPAQARYRAPLKFRTQTTHRVQIHARPARYHRFL